MSRFIYVNGRYMPYAEANVHVEDRGFQFADAVYEVIEVRGQKLVDATQHLERLNRSLREISMPAPMSERALRHVIAQTVRRNHVRDGLVYLQVSRGSAPRDFMFPSPDETWPTLVCIARSTSLATAAAKVERGIAVTTSPDIRWGRCDIKTVMLLPACLAKTDAKQHEATEAWFFDDEDRITEGASSNAWIIRSDGRVITRGLDHRILPGITRATTKKAIAKLGLTFEERAFTRTEAYEAEEAFVTAASSLVMPVVKIDGRAVGDGKPGEKTLALRRLFHSVAELSDL